MYDKRVGLVAGDQSAACLAQVIFGHIGGEVYTEKRIHVSEILTLYIICIVTQCACACIGELCGGGLGNEGMILVCKRVCML